jgi:3D-(3,5/4)-trihydroxycyclohexane-1,2-dione acylhydrolase (decyclizing)
MRVISSARCPLIIAGGGVLYSEAWAALAAFARQTGIAVGETQAGKGSLSWDHPQLLGAMGSSGSSAANIIARDADVVIGIGTRYSDFTTASHTAFQNPNLRFVNINVAEFDAYKQSAIAVVADARVALEELSTALRSYHVPDDYAARVNRLHTEWDQEVDRLFNLRHGPPISQSEAIGVVNSTAHPRDVVVCAAGSLPGDLHKLWRSRDPKSYHLEYGYSCMGYEIAGGLGIKLAAPDREVYVMVGDGSYLMMAQEIATSIQEHVKLNIVVIDNHGFGSINGLSQACGVEGFGTLYRYRVDGQLSGDPIPVDFVANAASLGAVAVRARTRDELREALCRSRDNDRTTVVVVETDLNQRVGNYETWWDVPIAEVAETESAREAHKTYVRQRVRERYYL